MSTQIFLQPLTAGVLEKEEVRKLYIHKLPVAKGRHSGLLRLLFFEIYINRRPDDRKKLFIKETKEIKIFY